jgi:acyl-coenzyme A synthetase/AMP-(fatty) acid ligase
VLPGKPKGVLHTTGGYMIYSAATSKHVFGLQRGDVYWCTADCGWITGHSYLAYGEENVGMTQVDHDNQARSSSLTCITHIILLILNYVHLIKA